MGAKKRARVKASRTERGLAKSSRQERKRLMEGIKHMQVVGSGMGKTMTQMWARAWLFERMNCIPENTLKQLIGYEEPNNADKAWADKEIAAQQGRSYDGVKESIVLGNVRFPTTKEFLEEFLPRPIDPIAQELYDQMSASIRHKFNTSKVNWPNLLLESAKDYCDKEHNADDIVIVKKELWEASDEKKDQSNKV